MMLTIYSKNNCAGCIAAASYLTSLEVPFNTVKIDEDVAAKAFILGEQHRSVPQIYYNGELFVEGGWNSLMKLSKEDIEAKMYPENTNA